MNSTEIKDLYKQNIMQTYGRFDVVLERGEGSRLYSPEGREYIDFTSGIGVNCLGYGNESWAKAIYDQALKLQHTSNLYYTGPGVELAKELTERSGMSVVFYANSGAESNEGAIKLARKYSFDKYGEGCSKIVTLYRSFHGRTITTLAATGQDSFHNYFYPFTEGFLHAEANNINSLKEAADGACAVMLELVQGEGGVLPLDKDYVKAVAAFCQENDLLLLTDEVQTGIGRTGTLFAFQQYGIMPDVVTFAKGIAGGLPMGGILVNEKCAGVLSPGTHATTFGGNLIAAAAALEVMRQLTPELLGAVAEKGAYIRDAIKGWNCPAVKEVRGLGLMLGVSVEGVKPVDLVNKCIDNGLLMLTAGSDALRMLPPLTITYEELDKGMAILKKVLEEV